MDGCLQRLIRTTNRFALKCQNRVNKWQVKTNDWWDQLWFDSVGNDLPQHVCCFIWAKWNAVAEIILSLRVPNSSRRFCSAPWIKTSSSLRCGQESKSPCTQHTCRQVSTDRNTAACVRLLLLWGSQTIDTVDRQVYLLLFLLAPSTNNPNSVSDWLPPCSYTETFREWASLQVCVPLPIGDAATVLKGLIK